VRLNEGRGRFYLEAKTTGAGAILLLKGRKSLYTDWLGKFKINEFLRKAQKTTRFRELMIERLAMTLGLLMVEEEEKGKLLNDITSKDRYTEQLIRSIELLQQGLATEEEAKRRMLLRYVHITKEYAIIQSNIRVEGTAVGLSGGILQLTDSNTTDEEVHALSALLRNDTSIEELYLRNNTITDDGARAIGRKTTSIIITFDINKLLYLTGAILSNHKNIRLIDLRGNKIGKPGVRILAEALEKSDRVSHVYVHIGGKIEALGETSDARSERMKGVEKAKNSEEIMSGKLSMNHIRKKPDPINQNENLKETDQAVSNIGTICIVDVRENTPTNTDGLYNQLQALDAINFVRPQYNQVSSGLLSGQQELLTSTLAQISGTGDNLNNNPSSPTSKGIKSLVKLNKGQKRQEKSELQMDGNGLISNPSDPNLDEKKSKNKV
jgi:myosin protein heavy chain